MDVYIYVIPTLAPLFRISSQLSLHFSALLLELTKGHLSRTSRVLFLKALDYENRNDIACGGEC